MNHIIPLVAAGMAVGHLPGHHVVGNPAEPAGDLDVDVAGVRALEPPAGGQDTEMLITWDQIVGDRQDRAAQVMVGAANQRAVASVDLVALMRSAQQSERGNT